MWHKFKNCLAAKQRDVALVDHEVFDYTQPLRVLYHCTDTEVTAAEVRLQQSAALDFYSARGVPSRDAKQATRFLTADAEAAENVMKQLCQQDETGGQKAVIIGPFPLHEFQSLEQKAADYHRLKETLDVQPDLVLVKKMVYLNFAAATDLRSDSKELGRTYAWVVYVPNLNFENTRVVMTIQELQDMAQRDPTLSAIATSILCPILRAIAVMKTTCAEYSNWKVEDNYVSFDLRVDGAEIFVTNACIHTIAETLLGTCAPTIAARSPRITGPLRKTCCCPRRLLQAASWTPPWHCPS